MSSTAVTGAEQPAEPVGDDRHQQHGSAAELAEVIPLPRARSSAELSSTEVTPSSAGLRDFPSIIEPLERRQHRRLIEPGLSLCQAAFASHPHGFATIAARAYREGRQPLSFLIRLVRDREHEIASALDEIEAAPVAPAAVPVDGERRQGTCYVCSTEAEVTHRLGVWWCDRHLADYMRGGAA